MKYLLIFLFIFTSCATTKKRRKRVQSCETLNKKLAKKNIRDKYTSCDVNNSEDALTIILCHENTINYKLLVITDYKSHKLKPIAVCKHKKIKFYYYMSPEHNLKKKLYE